MEKDVSYYVQNILKKQLKDLKISNYGLYQILNNVKIQLESIIKNWVDKEFINTLFVMVNEEGLFYEPKTTNNIGSLVVLTIRNSLLEVIASIDYGDYGLKNAISDSDIRNITTTAIEYFMELNLDELSKKIEINEDYYRIIIDKYPVAWNSLTELSKCNDGNLERTFKSYPYKKEYEIEELSDKVNEATKINYENGISAKFNDSLISYLNGIKNKKTTLLYVDSFKYLSRNIEKILKVLEFILTHDALFITNNYCISKEYVSRRKEIIRSSHKQDFNEDAIKTINEVSKTYGEKLLKAFLQTE